MSEDFPTACHSTRISIRWPPEDAYENTETTVLSVGGWYLDLRVDVSEVQEGNSKTMAEEKAPRIDWALAGRRIIESNEPLQVLFTHFLDSYNQFSTVDCGIFVNLPNGDQLETGTMPRKPGGSPLPYEEIWRDLPPLEGPEDVSTNISRTRKAQAWILESLNMDDKRAADTESTEIKIFLARLGGTFLALQQAQTSGSAECTVGNLGNKTGGEVSALLEEWRGDPALESSQQKPKWVTKYALGSQATDLPSLSTRPDSRFLGEGEGAWRQVGGIVWVLDRQYTVRAYEESGL